MRRYIIKRLLSGFWVLFGVITLVFFLFNVLPGDPAKMLMGQRADSASVAMVRADLGLDKPIFIQYVNYLNDLSPLGWHEITTQEKSNRVSAKYGKILTLVKTKDHALLVKAPYLRRSYQNKQKVGVILTEAFPKTLILATVSILFAFIIGLIIGIFSALYRDGIFDKLALLLSVFGMSLPSFFAAILIAWIFAYLLGDFTGFQMVGSLYTVDDFGRGEYLTLKNLILPAFTLGIRPLAIITELTRSSLLEVLGNDYIRTARAKGLSKMRIITRHALRNALNPVITAVSGWFASLMAGAVFVEYVFDWKGIGVVIVQALDKLDFPVVMGAILLISLMLVIINIFVDLIYGFLDPRIRLSS